MKSKLLSNITICIMAFLGTLLIADNILKTINRQHYKKHYGRQGTLNSNNISELRKSFEEEINNGEIGIRTPLILFFGDSITAGVPLKNPQHAYPGRFDEILRAADSKLFAKNISGPGSNIKDAMEWYSSVVEENILNDKVAVFGYCLNDIMFSLEPVDRGIKELLKPKLSDSPHAAWT